MKQTRIDGLDLPAVASSGARSANAAPAFNVDVARSVRLHPLLALSVAAVTFVLILGYALTRTPMYKAESLTYVEPLASKVMDDGSPGSYDPSRYDSYLQQQIQTATRPDILEKAIASLPPGSWQRPGEDIHAAAARLAESLKVQRVLQSYQLSISLTAPNPEAAAAIVNAATSTYLEAGRKDENVQSDGRLQLLVEERDRIQSQLDADHAEQTTLGSALGVADTSAGSGNPYDMQLAGIRTELVAARDAHAIAAAQLESVSTSSVQGATGLNSVADDAIASDPGLGSLKASLSSRRAQLNSQMAGMTPSNPVYKQDQEEIAQLDRSLETRMGQLRVAAEKRVEDKLRLDLQRTGDIEAKLNGQLAQQTALAHSAAPKLQRASELAADVNRLQVQYTNVDAAMRGLKLETTGPGVSHLVVAASVPTSPEPSRRTLLLALALPLALLFGAAAAVTAKKRDPRIYTEGDVENEIGFLPIGVTPASEEVSAAAVEEYLLRMAAALERAYRVGSARSFVFTAASRSTGVSPFVNAMQRKLGELGFNAIAIGASQALATEDSPTDASLSDSGIIVPAPPGRQEGHAAAKLERLKRKHDFLLIDAQPLLHSAEAEYAVRSTDATILVIESGVTTATELRQAGLLLQRLNVQGVGAVLQHLHLKVGNSEFRSSIHVLEKQTRHERHEEEKHEIFAAAPVLEQRLHQVSRRIVFLEAASHPEVEESEPAATIEPETHREPGAVSFPQPVSPVSVAPQTVAPQPTAPVASQPIAPLPYAAEPLAPAPFASNVVAQAPFASAAHPLAQHEQALQSHALLPVPEQHTSTEEHPQAIPSAEPAPASDRSRPEPAKRDFRLWEEVIMQPESLHTPSPSAQHDSAAHRLATAQTTPWQSEPAPAAPVAPLELLRGHSPLLEADNFVEAQPIVAKPTRAFAAWQPEPTERYEPVLDRNKLPAEPLDGAALDAFLKTFTEVPAPAPIAAVPAVPAPAAPAPVASAPVEAARYTPAPTPVLPPVAPFETAMNRSTSTRESIRGFEPPLHALPPQEPTVKPSRLPASSVPSFGMRESDPAAESTHTLQDRISVLRDSLRGGIAREDAKAAEPKQSVLRRSFFWLRKHAAEPSAETPAEPVKPRHQKGADPVLERAIERVLESPRRAAPPAQPAPPAQSVQPAPVSSSAMVFAETAPETERPATLTVSEVEDAPSIFLDSKSVPIAGFAAANVSTPTPVAAFVPEPAPVQAFIETPAPQAATPPAPARSEKALAAARLAASMAAALPPVEEPADAGLWSTGNVPEWLASAQFGRTRPPTSKAATQPAPAAEPAAEPEPDSATPSDFAIKSFDTYSSSLEDAFASLTVASSNGNGNHAAKAPATEAAADLTPSWVDSLTAWSAAVESLATEPVDPMFVDPRPIDVTPPAAFRASLLPPVEVTAIHYEPEPVVVVPIAAAPAAASLPVASIPVAPAPAALESAAAFIAAPLAVSTNGHRNGHPSGSFKAAGSSSRNNVPVAQPAGERFFAQPAAAQPVATQPVAIRPVAAQPSAERVIAQPAGERVFGNPSHSRAESMAQITTRLSAEPITAPQSSAFAWKPSLQPDLVAAAPVTYTPAPIARDLYAPMPAPATRIAGPLSSTPLPSATTFRPAPANGYTNGHSNGPASGRTHISGSMATFRPAGSSIARPLPSEARKPVASAAITPEVAAAEAAAPRRWHMLSRFDPGVVAAELLGVTAPRERVLAAHDTKDRAAG
jgi:uncharacterized protein involved in exopolysaccharide biosynthesis